MSSDGRYMYHHPPGMTSSYDYPYPTSSYEPPQIPQPPPRQIRSNSSQSQSPHQQQSSFNPPPSSYPAAPPNYGPPSYSMQQPNQWPAETWGHYPPPFPPPPVAEVPFNSGPGRPDVSPAVPVEQRPYVHNPPQPDPRRIDDRPALPSATTPQAKSRRRGKETSTGPALPGPGTPPALDFMKLIDSYRSIMDASNSLSNGNYPAQGRPQPAEVVERMMESATRSLQMLESVTAQSSSPENRPASDRDAEESKENGASASSAKRQKAEDPPSQEGQMCLGCRATSTPEWRRGPMGPRTLCNACGLVYAKLIKKRVREGGRAYSGGGKDGGQHNPDDDASSGEGGSEGEDGDSYGSQDRSEGRD